MTGLPDRSDAGLAPVRGALRDAATAEAASLRDAARRQGDGLLAAASSTAERTRRSAAAQGEEVARSATALRSARVRREAHEAVLAQQQALRLELQRQVRQAATALRTDPRYPQILDQLTAHGRGVLGPGATVVESPDGGVVAELGSHRLDLSLPVLALQVLESHEQEVRRLWTR